MGLAQESRSVYNAVVGNGAITYAVGLTATPASGAPGAYAKVLADVTPTTPWWLVALVYGNLSAAGAAAFDYRVTRGEAGALVTFGILRILLEAAAVAQSSRINLPFPVRSELGVGAAAQQFTASGKTLDVTIQYVTGVGN